MLERDRRIAERAETGGTLRQLGNEFHLSYEWIRQILIKSGTQRHRGLVNQDRLAEILGISSHTVAHLRLRGVLTPTHSTSNLVLYVLAEAKPIASQLITCPACGNKKKTASRVCYKCWRKAKVRRKFEQGGYYGEDTV